jgi:hypothetical protein
MSNHATSDAEYAPPRKKHSLLWWIAGFFFLLIVLFVYQLFGPNPRIIVSKQTTFITEPLGPNGLPDYEQYILNKLRDGVTPENNAVTLLWQALFPAGIDPKFHAAVAAELGLEEIPSHAEALQSYYSAAMKQRLGDFLTRGEKARRNTEPPANDAADDAEAPADGASGGYSDGPLASWQELNPGAVDKLLDDVASRPWTSEQVPPLAEWAKANKAPLDLLVAASRRERYYAPSETLLNNDRDMLIAMLLPMIQNTRDAGRALSVRAMWHLGEGRPTEAWEDLLAIHRLSHLVSQGCTLVEQLVGLALSGIACDCTVTFLDHAELTADQARQVQRDLAGLRNFAVMARSLNQGERLMALDAFTRIGSDGGGEIFSGINGGNAAGSSAFEIVSVDWNLVLRETNRWYDRLVAAAQLPDREARVAALAKIDADIAVLQQETRTPKRLLAAVVSRQQRSKVVSGIILSLFLPALNAAIEAEDRQNTMLELTRLAAALAVYRAEHGAYPASIDELRPQVIERLPVDALSGKVFIYKRQAEGFLLYGVGANGADDGGSNEQHRVLTGQQIDMLDESEAEARQAQIPKGADDFSILVPRPKFELPKTTAPTIEQE